jgi:hypothetical protein
VTLKLLFRLNDKEDAGVTGLQIGEEKGDKNFLRVLLICFIFIIIKEKKKKKKRSSSQGFVRCMFC